MITPAFSLTATERVLPKLALDFTTALLDPRVTCTRALNTATRFNSSGYIENVLANTARFDFDSIALTCRGLLIEESRQNTLTYSNTFSDVSWTKANVTLSASGETSPDGTTNATKVDISAATGIVSISKTLTVVAGTSYTMSSFAKKGELNFVNLGLLYNANEYAGTQFNLDTGAAVRTFAAGAGYTATNPQIRPLRNGWYWISVTVTTGRTTTFPCVLPSNTTWSAGRLDQSLTGNGTDGIHIWETQFEVGAFATSLIQNASTTLNTRNADVVSMTGTNFSDWYNATEGTFMVQGIPSVATSSGALSIDDGTSAERMQIRALSGVGFGLVIDGGAPQASLVTGTWTAGASGKCVLAYKASSFACAAGGDVPATSPSGTVPTVTQMQIGSGVSQTYFNGRIEKISYWPQRCINNEVRAFSK